jgi:hypothetical protein
VNNGNGGAVNGCLLTNSSATYAYAAPYPTAGTSVVIGISPADVCLSLGQNSGLPGATTNPNSMCTGSPYDLTPPSATSATPMALDFFIAGLPTAGISNFELNQFTPTTNSSNNVTFSTALPYSAFFQNSPPSNSITCPDPGENGFYFPGDTQIQINTSNFNYNPAPTMFDFAPNTGLVAFAEPFASASGSGQVPTLGSSNYFRRVSINNPNATLGNLKDSTSSTGFYYNFGFGLLDAAGFVVTDTGQSVEECQLNNVQVTAINGFLGQSKCFIATAAYRSGTAAPVMMLRRFRDQVLLRFGPGREFVSWYYSWSPPAAEWLLAHPIYRYPVLVALVPVEVFAWLCLNPYIFLLLSVSLLFLSVWLKYRDAVRQEEAFAARVRGEWP